MDKGADWFAVDASDETLARTAPGMWEEGRRLNLERALKLGDELGGYIVTGHVDGVGEVLGVCEEGGSHRVGFRVPPALGYGKEGVEGFVPPDATLVFEVHVLGVNHPR